MKVCVPIEVKPQGGVYTFVQNLLSWLQQHGVAVTRDVDDVYDVLFVNSWIVPYATIRRAKQRQPAIRVVQRVDGAAVDYGSDAANDRAQARANLLADLTIFQSEYSRYSTTTKFHVIAQDGPVIYNPVDIALFTPGGPCRDWGPPPRIACASWSVNRKKGTWQVDELAAAHPDVEFVLCGRFEGITDRPNVRQLGHLDRGAMADALRSCDLFLNLSENDPCPNVVLEALASGLPVIYKPSGGVPELVGDCGAPMADLRAFRAIVDGVQKQRDVLSAMARQRATTVFAPDIIFPRYLSAMRTAERKTRPGALHLLSLAHQGFPVLPAAPSGMVGRVLRGSTTAVRGNWRRQSPAAIRVGWVTFDAFPRRKRRFAQLDSFTRYRAGAIGSRLNAEGRTHHELYHPDREYDVVIFQKMMDVRCQGEMARVQAYGGKVIFDANVNYYERWGDYFVSGTEPSDEQQRDAIHMTRHADWVVADSSYLLSVIRQFTDRATWIADSVDLSVYSGVREHDDHAPLQLVWSGVARKAAHLLEAREAFARLQGVELTLVSDEKPAVLDELQALVPCRFMPFSDARYARALLSSDVIISPKRLVNAYEMGHTEYKITLGMAVGLPAIASPQQSYVEAIGHRRGGFVCTSTDEWVRAIDTLRSAGARREIGARARQTVQERYSVDAIAGQYLELLLHLVPTPRRAATVG